MAGSKTILFIEDDQFVAEMYTHVLENQGYDVTLAEDGQTGVEKAKQGKYDLILLDLLLPEKLGIEVLEELKGKDGQGLPESKIIVLTNLAQDKDNKRVLEAQADGYLIKTDVTPHKLASIVKEVIG